MPRVDPGGAFLLVLLKVLRGKLNGGCELGFSAKRSNSRLTKHGICACCSGRGLFASGGLHPAPPCDWIRQIRFCYGPVETLSLVGRYALKEFAVPCHRFQELGC